MPKHYYDHNVDVRSTQAANAFKSAGKFGEKLFVVAGLCFFGSIVLAVGTGGLIQLSMHLKTSGNPKNLDPLAFKSENIQNSTRAKRKFMNEYVNMRGRITDLNDYVFTVETSNATIECRLPDWYFAKQWYNRDYVDNYNMGQWINVKGILENTNNTSTKFWLKHCMPYK